MTKEQLDSYIRRLIEVQTELGDMNTIFDEQVADQKRLSSAENLEQQIMAMASKYRIPGFQAYHLAVEGYSLLNLVALGAAVLKKNSDPELEEKLEVTQRVLDETEPLLLTTIEHMATYRSLDTDEIIQHIEEKLAKENKS